MIEEKKAGRKFIEIQDCTKQRDIHSTKLKVGKRIFFSKSNTIYSYETFLMKKPAKCYKEPFCK
jgi:hypothetical protein